MKILWTRSPNLADWIIRLATGEDCCHLALLFESRRGGSGVIFEANLLGAHPAFLKTWMKKGRTIIHEREVTLTDAEEDKLWDAWVETFDGAPYDFGGVLYLGLWKFWHRLTGRKLPLKNKWAKRRAYFCDEIYQLIAHLPGLTPVEFRANGMATPHDVWTLLKQSGG